MSSRCRPVSRSAAVSASVTATLAPGRCGRSRPRCWSRPATGRRRGPRGSRGRRTPRARRAAGRTGRRGASSVERRRVERPHRGVRGVEEARPGAGRGEHDPPADDVRRAVGVARDPDVAQPELPEATGLDGADGALRVAVQPGEPGLVAGVDAAAQVDPAPGRSRCPPSRVKTVTWVPVRASPTSSGGASGRACRRLTCRVRPSAGARPRGPRGCRPTSPTSRSSPEPRHRWPGPVTAAVTAAYGAGCGVAQLPGPAAATVRALAATRSTGRRAAHLGEAGSTVRRPWPSPAGARRRRRRPRPSARRAARSAPSVRPAMPSASSRAAAAATRGSPRLSALPLSWWAEVSRELALLPLDRRPDRERAGRRPGP